MKNIFLILFSLFIFVSCTKDEPSSPIDDEKEFLVENPYSVIFENRTDGDLYLKCEGLASNHFPTLKQGAISDKYHGANQEISIEYSGEGTHFSTVKKTISLSKETTVRVYLTYP